VNYVYIVGIISATFLMDIIYIVVWPFTIFIAHVHRLVLENENEEADSSGKASDFCSGVFGSNLCLDTENIDLHGFTQTLEAD
jgi:hypothetical protein